MEKQLSPSEQYVPFFRNYLMNRLINLKEEENEIRKILAQLPKTNDLPPAFQAQKNYVHESGYRNEWSWLKKIKFVLEMSNRALSANEITDRIVAIYEANLIRERKKIFGTISAQLSNNKNDFKRNKNEADEFVYELIEKITTYK